MQSCRITPFCMSVVKREGSDEVIYTAYEVFHKSKEDQEEYEGQNLFYDYGIRYCPMMRMVTPLKLVIAFEQI